MLSTTEKVADGRKVAKEVIRVANPEKIADNVASAIENNPNLLPKLLKKSEKVGDQYEIVLDDLSKLIVRRDFGDKAHPLKPRGQENRPLQY